MTIRRDVAVWIILAGDILALLAIAALVARVALGWARA
jgi:hypothetical protein